MTRPTWPALRDGILFFTGIFGVAFEVLFRRPPDYGVLPVLAGFAGLPAFIKRDKDADDNTAHPAAEEDDDAGKT